jgi:alpha-tubulin suppressor-like RCC1 family protein
LHCWGADDTSQLAAAGFDGEIQDLSLGDGHGCLIASSQVWCWGRNDHGQAGQPAGAPLTEPTPLISAIAYTHVSVGESHSCALSGSGDVWCWGNNEDRQAGHEGASTHIHMQVTGGPQFTAVVAGDSHTCAIGTDAQGYCWGSNARRQLGGTDADLPSSHSASLVAGGYTFAQISAGGDFTCGVSPSGLPVCWGAGDRGQLGSDGTSDQGVPLVLALSEGGSVSTIHAGGEHACALSPAGVLCWGAHEDGRLGIDTTVDVGVPTAITSSETFTAIDGGRSHHCGRTPDQRVLCWGAAPGAGDDPIEIQW